MTSRTTTLRGIPMHYEERGAGRPVLVLHGLGFGYQGMIEHCEPVFGAREHADATWRRIYLDLPGHGTTPAPRWLNSDDQMLDLVVEMIDAVVTERRFVLIGLSWGAYLAWGVANRMAGRLDGAMFVVPLLHAERATRDLPPTTAVVQEPGAVAELDSDPAVFTDAYTVHTREMVSRFREQQRAMRPPDEAFLERLEPRYPFSFEDRLRSRVDAPCLIVMGRQDAIVGYRDAWPILELLPRATFAVLDRAGHGLPHEQQRLFQALAAEWLDRVEEFGDPGGGPPVQAPT